MKLFGPNDRAPTIAHDWRLLDQGADSVITTVLFLPFVYGSIDRQEKSHVFNALSGSQFDKQKQALRKKPNSSPLTENLSIKMQR